ncbi:uncharacterized protein LOC109709843 isoform X2 [Ananas comosus]|uniref:Uncharacterized protein LOC109709843 isoform X2 n=1 Tax=Ananas comosus TaxID=4615 RepID=A0A6P5EVG6_ANACO|nr:uncharacterized protein LOC109709843 isoform X2 [Ananas comosus]
MAGEEPPFFPPPTDATVSDADMERKILFDSTAKVSSIFMDFMIKVAKFEELVDVAKQFLMRLHQEIEYFRRPKLDGTSKIVDEIIRSNFTEKMKAYVEAGCNHSFQNIQNISQIQSCEEGLRDHLKKAKTLLDEVECLAKDAYGITQATNQSTSKFFENDDCNSLIDDVLPTEDETRPLHLQDNLILYVTTMMVIYGMLKLDYAMQEKIVQSLNLKTSSSELESYCLMWDLRPYINDSVMHRAWKYVP